MPVNIPNTNYIFVLKDIPNVILGCLYNIKDWRFCNLFPLICKIEIE